MKTIEKRAKENIEKEGCINTDWNNGYEEGYIQGATDQRTIDIDKACEWLRGEIYDLEEYDDFFINCKNCFSVDELVTAFRKAMEE